LNVDVFGRVKCDISPCLQKVDAIVLERFPETLVWNHPVLRLIIPDIRRQSCLVVSKISIETNFPVDHPPDLHSPGIDKERLIQSGIRPDPKVKHRVYVKVKIGVINMEQIGFFLVQRIEQGLFTFVRFRPRPFPVVVPEIFQVEQVRIRVKKAGRLRRIQELNYVRALVRFGAGKYFVEYSSRFNLIAVDTMVVVFIQGSIITLAVNNACDTCQKKYQIPLFHRITTGLCLSRPGSESWQRSQK